jgi:hypothetical protein
MQQNNPWVDPERWERQKQDVGTAEVHIRGKIVPTTISTTRWLSSQATRADRDKGRIGVMVNKTEGREVVLLGGRGISRAMHSRAKRGVSMKRGQGTRDTPGDQRDRKKRGIERDIEVGVRVARETGMRTVGEMTASAIGIVIGTVIGEIEGIRLVILYIRIPIWHVSRCISITSTSSHNYLFPDRFCINKAVMPSSSLPELHCRLYR